MVDGIRVYVLRQPGTDCTLDGVTSRHEFFTLVWGLANSAEYAALYEQTPGTQRLELRERMGQLQAVPIGDPREKDPAYSTPCFGGNFVYSSDSRFPNLYPIPVHDRFETLELSAILSD